MNDFTLSDLDEGMRVELHPGTDAWMSGDRYGEIAKVGRKLVHVYMDRSRSVRRLRPEYIHAVVMTAPEWAAEKERQGRPRLIS